MGELRRIACSAVVLRLEAMRLACKSSNFFATHEMVGTSLLFVLDSDGKSGVWMIDFAKCRKVTPETTITHSVAWEYGNHEDGWLVGLESLLSIWREIGEKDPEVWANSLFNWRGANKVRHPNLQCPSLAGTQSSFFPSFADLCCFYRCSA